MKTIPLLAKEGSGVVDRDILHPPPQHRRGVRSTGGRAGSCLARLPLEYYSHHLEWS